MAEPNGQTPSPDPVTEGFAPRGNGALDEVARHYFEDAQKRRMATTEGQDPPIRPDTRSAAERLLDGSGQAPEPPAGDDPASSAPPPVPSDAPPADASPEPPSEPDPASDAAEAVIELSTGERLTPAEIEAGYLRQSDYTRKTQELADQRRALEGERVQVSAEQQQAFQAMRGLADELQAEIQRTRPRPQDLEQLRAQNPAEYAALMMDLQRQDHLLNAARQEEARQQYMARQAQVPQERQALMEANPAFAEDFAGTYRKVGEWVTSPEGGGLPPEMWDQTLDHRLVNIAYKAMQLDEATRSQPKVARQLRKNPRVIRPGAPPEPGETAREQYDTAKARMRSDGSLESIHAAFLAKERLRGSSG